MKLELKKLTPREQDRAFADFFVIVPGLKFCIKGCLIRYKKDRPLFVSLPKHEVTVKAPVDKNERKVFSILTFGTKQDAQNFMEQARGEIMACHPPAKWIPHKAWMSYMRKK